MRSASAAILIVFLISSAIPLYARDCAWPVRIPVQVTIGGTPSTGELRINLTNTDFPDFYIFSSDGDDVRVYEADGTTPIDHFVTSWNSVGRTGTIFLRPGTLAAGSSHVFLIEVGNPSVGPAGNVASVFPEVGMRLHSRSTSADPTSPEDGLAAFAAATIDVDNSVRASISGLNNRALGGANGNYGWCVSALIEVSPAETGVWEFRYGGDFGRGGHLFIAETELESHWNDDLWWALSFANINETLEGSLALTPGWHRYEALGFEGCCDGPVGWQGRKPGGPWLDFNTTNFSMRAAQCIAPDATVTTQPNQNCSTELSASKVAAVTSDPLTNPSPYAVPGSIVQYEIKIENPGAEVDSNTINLTDILPDQVDLVVSGATAFEFIDGSPSSTLNLNWGGTSDLTDEVEFSVDGSDFTYIPTASGAHGTDAAVTHVRFRPTGSFTPFNSANGVPYFAVRFSVLIK